jgi:hypothetical protein
MNALTNFVRVPVRLYTQVFLVLMLVACTPVDKSTAEVEKTQQKKDAQANNFKKSEYTPQLKVKDPLSTRNTGSCADFSQKDCLNSSKCLLDQDKTQKYVCRSAKGACEIGFVQLGRELKKSCEGKKFCKFTAASCFCPEGVQCVCGGGKPAVCKTKKTSQF